jgi:4'-phosphopantetheinyl transferase
LKNGEMHIWLISLDIAKYDLHVLRRHLSIMELAKAERFHFDIDRNRYVIGRGVLRLLLEQYLNVPPAHLEFCHNQYGKPFLDPHCNSMGILFNVSHSSEIMICAITSAREIGIDIEYVSSDIDVLELADRFFTPQEAVLLKSLHEEDRRESFYVFWTIKEAYLKALGTGIANGLDHFDIPFPVLESLLRNRNAKTQTRWRKWRLKILRQSPGYIAAIAVKGPQLKLKYWDWIDFLSSHETCLPHST